MRMRDFPCGSVTFLSAIERPTKLLQELGMPGSGA
jgi:hypothetical protein